MLRGVYRDIGEREVSGVSRYYGSAIRGLCRFILDGVFNVWNIRISIGAVKELFGERRNLAAGGDLADSAAGVASLVVEVPENGHGER